MDVLLAIRMSFSIPFVFTPVKYNNNFYVDGSVLNDFPIDLCDKDNFIGIFISLINIKLKKVFSIIYFIN